MGTMTTTKRCDVEGCPKPFYGRQWCKMHYERWRKYGDPETAFTWAGNPKGKVCAVDRCGLPAHGNGLCSKHYARWLAHGDPTKGAFKPRSTDPCEVEGCQRTRVTRGLCPMHYSRWLAHGDPTVKAEYPDTCTIDGCARKYWARGYCRPHYKTWLAHGDPLWRPYRIAGSTCEETDCAEPAYSNRRCRQHYYAWRWATDRDRIKDRMHKRRAWMARNPTAALTRSELRKLAMSPCFACGSLDRLSLDHLIPVSRGGPHAFGNLVVLCRSCNSSKGGLTWAEWRYSGRPRAVQVFGGHQATASGVPGVRPC